MKFSTWFAQVEQKLNYTLDNTLIEDALEKYLNNWTVDEYATEIDNFLEQSWYEQRNPYYAELNKY
jgi:hypothetical protein